MTRQTPIVAATDRATSTEAARGARRARLLRRLGAERFRAGLWGVWIPALVTMLAAALRVPGLARPHELIFDETYYAKDAYALLQAGYELSWPEEADEAFLAGAPAPEDEASFVVHPPLGKWLIALGIRAVGADSAVGWRIASVVAGVLSVLLVALIAQRMFRSVFLGGVAGVLLAVEGHHLVMSRAALLDIFLALFVLAAFGALLADRWQGRRRLAELLAHAPEDGGGEGGRAGSRRGPLLLWRPWRLAAAVLLGCATSVKLSALAFVAVFGVLVVLWDLQARRAAGLRGWSGAGLRDGLLAVVTVLPLAAVTYVITWTGWLVTSGGWGRTWHLTHPAEGLGQLVPGPLRSLWHYHVSILEFHEGLSDGHDYASSPWTWPFMGRPVSMHYESIEAGSSGCGEAACSQAVLDLANPVIWWGGLVALLVVVALWLGRRDWRHGAILSGVLAGWAVWLFFPARTMFFFYTVAYEPFLILALVAVAALVMRRGAARAGGRRPGRAGSSQRAAALVLAFVLLATAASIFFHPLWTAELIPTDQWRWRMWLESWV